jgi:hypothetical protein
MLIMILPTIVVLVLIQWMATHTEQQRRTWRAETLLERAEEDLDLAVRCEMVKSKKDGHEPAAAGAEAWLRGRAR